MGMYKCVFDCGHTEHVDGDELPRENASHAAKRCVENVWFSEVIPKADEYRVTVTDATDATTTWDIHVEGIELDLTAMPASNS